MRKIKNKKKPSFLDAIEESQTAKAKKALSGLYSIEDGDFKTFIFKNKNDAQGDDMRDL